MNRHFILFALAFAAALSGVAKTFDVDISTGRPAASNEAYYHGETIEFRAVRGRSVVTNVEYSCVYYQTNGMNQAWWKTDGLVFHPTNDVGAASYRFFLEGRDDLGRDWHANGLLRLLPSPGFTPNTIELPVATLDFAAVEVANAPYYTKAETEAKIVEIAPAPGDYAAVSNAAVYAAITNALQDTALAGTATKADATLTERGHSAWEPISYPVGIDAISDFTVSEYENGGASNVYTLRVAGHYDDGDISTDFDTNSIEPAQGTDTGCSFDCGGPWGIGSFVVSRTALSGYVLGGDTNHILAAQSQVDELGSSVASNAAAVAALEDTTSALSDSIPSVALTNETLYVDGWKTNVVTRRINGAVVIGYHKEATRPGENCLANGYNVDARGYYSHAEGANTSASGYHSHAEGANTSASGNYSHAEGSVTSASATGSHAEGASTSASGNYSHAEGSGTSAAAPGSHAEGKRASVTLHDDYAWCWQGVNTGTYYNSHGPGTFNINPAGGIDGFWIGETNFTQHVRNIAGSGGGGSAAPKRIAMFVIPVNEGGPFTYKGFELKCSTNSFASAASESVKLQFYSQSEIADEGSGSTIDKMRLFACTSYWSGRDRRSYSPIGNTIDYGNDLYSVVVLVDATCLVRHPEDNGAWLSEDNEDLVWCYMRDTANDVEREQLTTEPLWRPIAPVRWFSKMPAWAN
ncbi:MAG: hypothetical protein IJI36_18775 [Kiritimatiellae bacterium]|nr:hypothetical protein [Kiritimatiellia bacterium]